MEIEYEPNSLRRELESEAKLFKKHGNRRAEIIKERLYELKAAACLSDLRHLPGPRLHQHTRLAKQKHAIFSVDLDHPYRLLFRVTDDPEPALPSGGVDWDRVQAITIIGVKDPHK